MGQEIKCDVCGKWKHEDDYEEIVCDECVASLRTRDFVDVEIPEAVAPGLQAELNGIAREMWRERLAAYAHDVWMQIAEANLPYLVAALTESGHVIDTCGCMTCTRVRRHRSLMVPYADLPEDEKASDRVQADKILAILRREG